MSVIAALEKAVGGAASRDKPVSGPAPLHVPVDDELCGPGAGVGPRGALVGAEVAPDVNPEEIGSLLDLAPDDDMLPAREAQAGLGLAAADDMEGSDEYATGPASMLDEAGTPAATGGDVAADFYAPMERRRMRGGPPSAVEAEVVEGDSPAALRSYIRMLMRRAKFERGLR